MNDFQKRKLKYKSPHVNPSAWKDAYREKCFQRLRARRANLIEKFRSQSSSDRPQDLLVMQSTSPTKIVSDVMELEWNALSPNRRFPSLRTKSSLNSVFEDPDDEVMIEALLQIQKELQSEEELPINEFLLHESNELASKVQLLVDDVICPVCQKGKLEETVAPAVRSQPFSFMTPPRTGTGSAVALKCCFCGLVLSSGNGAKLTLKQVQMCIYNTLRDHSRDCSFVLTFSATEDNGGTNILVTCGSCDWMSFLL